MKPDLIDKISDHEKIQRKDMIEKDIILHQILSDLSKEKFFSDNFIFKGGTCLMKHYLGYLRFSEDIDFTWKDQSLFAGKTRGQAYKELSKSLEKTGKILEKIASKRGLDFKWDKGNRDYVELVNGGKICTFKIYYDSSISKKKTFLKVQINFMDVLCLKPKKGSLKSLMAGKHPELKKLFEEYSEYTSAIPFGVYDVKEILSEKIRALLTRRGIKARDFLDVFFISKDLDVKPESVEKYVIAKISYALEHFEKYGDNFEEKKKLLDKGQLFDWGTEKGLLITKIDEKEFMGFVDGFMKYLKTLIKKIPEQKTS